jgi:hypothetical protein
MFKESNEAGITEAAAAATGLGELVSKRIAPISDWSDMGRTEHFVQFYDNDQFIVNSVAEYVIHGLRSGETCIVAATREHLADITQVILSFGTELERARIDGRYIPLDAVDTLTGFMVDGLPDAGLFAELIGGVIDKAARRGNDIRVFGEMVGVLCSDNNYDAALNLEDLWNGLRKEYRFSLFCAYPMNGLDLSGRDRMAHICSSHTRVIPDETYTSLTNADERLRMIASLQLKGRQFEAEIAELERRIASR